MGAFLVFGGVLMMFATGNGETIEGNVGDNVLLNCLCPEIDLRREFQWQKEKPERVLIFEYHSSVPSFLDEKKDNCSYLLPNITAGDQGEYICYFYSQRKNQVQKKVVYLKVYASYRLCQVNTGADEFSCDVKGRHGKAEIQWTLNGNILKNSSTITIIPSHTLSTSNEHHFTSRLTSKLNMTSEPTCEVKVENISPNTTTDSCESINGGPQPITGPESTNLLILWILALVLLVLIVSLALWCYRRSRTNPEAKFTSRIFKKYGPV